MSYGEPVALRGQMDLEQVVPAAAMELVPTAEAEFIERLKRGEAAAFEEWVADRSGEIYGLLFRLTENSEGSSRLDARDIFASFPEHRSLSRRGGLENLDLSDRDQPGTKSMALVAPTPPRFDGLAGCGAGPD